MEGLLLGIARQTLQFGRLVERTEAKRVIWAIRRFLSPLQGLKSFCSLTQGGARFTSLALGYYLPGFQPFQSEPPHVGCYGFILCSLLALGRTAAVHAERPLLTQAAPGEGRARVRAGRPAWRVFPQWAGPRGVGGTRACFAESWLDQRSWSAVEELLFKALPRLLQSVPGEDGLKARGVERRAFDELEQASLVLGATGLERDGSQMLGGEV